MCGYCASTARRLQSVALRYRQPICTAGDLRLVPALRCRVRFPGLRGWGGSVTDQVASLAAAEELSADAGPSARCGGLARLEAVLFLARQPQASRKLAQLAGLADGTEARTLVRKLNRLYDSGGSAFRVEEVAGGFQLMSRSKFAPWLRRLHNLPVEVRLSAPAMETLAVVAYRQPVLRADIEAIRGVQCGEILRQLIERELVRIVGRSEELGRPFLYGTTRQFLQVFGLRHLDELPRRESLKIARPDTADNTTTDAVTAEQAEADQQIPHDPHHSHSVPEEAEVKTATATDTRAEDLQRLSAGNVFGSPVDEQLDPEYSFDEEETHDDDNDDNDDDEYDEDDYDEDEYDEEEDDDEEEDEEEDEDFEDESWEEVEDDDEEDDEEDEDEDEWEDEDDEEWDEDEYDDEEDEEDEEEEEEEEED